MRASVADLARSCWLHRPRALRSGGLALLLIVAMASTARAETIRIGGTGSGLGTMQRLAEVYARKDPSVRVTVVPNLGSAGGVKALQAGAVDLAVISRSPKAEELAGGLVAIEYGRTPFVFVTNVKTGASDISRRAAADYFSGRVAQWPDGVPVRLVLRPLSDGDTALQGAFSPAMADAVKTAHARAGMVIANTDQEAVDETARLAGSLGNSSLALLLAEERRLRILALDGVTPSVRTLADGTYPYHKPMYLLRKRDGGSAAVVRFIEFVRSSEGREILERFGHWVPR